VERNLYGGIDALKKTKGSIEFGKKEKEKDFCRDSICVHLREILKS
jgi:hypothetical protein